MKDLLFLGAEAEGGVISLKEWERPGTMWVMELEEVSYSETGYGYGGGSGLAVVMKILKAVIDGWSKLRAMSESPCVQWSFVIDSNMSS